MKNISFALISSWFFLWLIPAGYGQTESLKVMSYNLLYYPSATDYSREGYLRNVMDEYRPDILAVCELETAEAAENILVNVLQPVDEAYAQARFEPNHSDPNSTLQQMLYYNSAKLALHNQIYLITEVRDINRYTLYLKTDRLALGDTTFVHVYVVHLKASSGDENEQKRYRMVEVLMEDAETLPEEDYVMVAGDFNFYNADEPGYQALTDTTRPPFFQDPVHREGYWHENTSFADLHTQSTHTTNEYPYDSFVTGGLDDRFDFIFTSSNLLDNTSDLYYADGTYAAFGNNGNCFNKRINDPSCTGEYSQELRDNLYEISDHIPVVLALNTTATFGAPSLQQPVFTVYPVPAHDFLYISGEIESRFMITDQTGKIIRQDLDGTDGKWYIGDLKPGVYYVQDQSRSHIPVVFIKH